MHNSKSALSDDHEAHVPRPVHPVDHGAFYVAGSTCPADQLDASGGRVEGRNVVHHLLVGVTDPLRPDHDYMVRWQEGRTAGWAGCLNEGYGTGLGSGRER